jgi:hypothetical protein
MLGIGVDALGDFAVFVIQSGFSFKAIISYSA